jgi:superfamily II DNA or RNA helicase
MEPASDLPGVQSSSWRQFVDFDGVPRRKQEELWEVIARGRRETPYLAVMCTGYGKTLAACGAYAVLRGQGRADRMLVLVPTDEQRRQWDEGARRNLAKCGVSVLGAYSLAKEPRDFKYAHDRKTEIFVATYQQAYQDPAYWERLLSQGQWFIVYDECHHLTAEGAWGKNTHSFASSERLYLTATPMRQDDRLLLGLPTHMVNGRSEYKADARVDYLAAHDEKAVKSVSVHIYHYFVDVEFPDGRIERVTAEKLRDEGVSDLGTYEQKREIRYKEKYLSPMLSASVADLAARNLVHPGQHQMLVFAMTCAHAEHVAHLLNLDAGRGFADWIGVTRRDQENRSVLDAYKAGKLPCLVQVDKAGEGFDNPRTSVLLFLHLIRSASKNIQQIGRGIRRNEGIRDFAADTCAILTSADSPLLDIALDFEKAVDAAAGEEAAERARAMRSEPDAPRLVHLPEVSVLSVDFDRVEQRTIGTSAPPVDLASVARGKEFLQKSGVDVDKLSIAELEGVGAGLSGVRSARTPSAEMFASESAKLEFERERVNKATTVLTNNVLQLRAELADGNGARRIERSLSGDIKRAINGEWVRRSGVTHGAMTSEHFTRKYEWLRSVNEALAPGKVPSWLLV